MNVQVNDAEYLPDGGFKATGTADGHPVWWCYHRGHGWMYYAKDGDQQISEPPPEVMAHFMQDRN